MFDLKKTIATNIEMDMLAIEIAFFAILILIFSAAYWLTWMVQFLMVKYWLYRDARAVNFGAVGAVASLIVIQLVLQIFMVAVLPQAVAFVAATGLCVAVGFLWLFFVASNADLLWRETAEKKWIGIPLAVASAWPLVYGLGIML